MAHAQKPKPVEYNFRSAAPLVASLENHNGQYLLNLANNGERELRGSVRLSLGEDGAQVEAGQINIVVSANESKLYLLKGLVVRGEHYTLRIYDEAGALLFYKIAKVRPVTDGIVSQAETVALSGAAASNTPAAPVAVPVAPAVSQPVNEGIQVKTRIAAGAQPDDPFVIAFELTGQRSLFDATFEANIGQAKMSKPISINRQAVVEFNVPTEMGDGKIAYTLLRKDGSVAAQGETLLDKLFSDDVITVSDIRTDKVSYAPGETARLTFALEGSSKEGYRLEITAYNHQDAQIFSTTLYGKGGERAAEQPVTLNVPSDSKERLVVKFQLFDAANGALFDAGERELSVREKP